MQLTRRGVCYNLYKTPYELIIDYQNKTSITYKFSSQTNLEKFHERLQNNREKINESLSKRFKFPIKQDIICDLKLYQMVETRGFLICNNGDYIECLDHIQLDGVEVMKKNLEE